MGIPIIIDSCDARRSWNIRMKTLIRSLCSKDVSNSSEHSWGRWMKLVCERTWFSSVDSWSHSFGDVASASDDFATTIKDLWIRKTVFLKFSLSFCIWHLWIRITKCKGWYDRHIVCNSIKFVGYFACDKDLCLMKGVGAIFHSAKTPNIAILVGSQV